MVRAALLFIAKLVVVSIVLFALWQGSLPGLGEFWSGGMERPWMAWQKTVLLWFYQVFDLEKDAYNQAWRLARGYILSVIPFLGLMIVGGPPGIRRRLWWILLGLAVIGLWQLCTPLILYFLYVKFGGGKSFFVGIFPVFMFSYALPFVLWVVSSRNRIEQWFAHRQASLPQESPD